jgi:predicted aminopeptidase
VTRTLAGQAARVALAVAALMVLGGCANLGYYWQSASGHVQVLSAARPVPEWLADPRAADRLKQQLRAAQRLRAFASRSLHLPDNASYTRYADLQRPAVLWNVVAAPPLSLALKTWCVPVAGCVGYRGYYDEARAQAEALEWRQQGYDVAVYPVPAYSTLGWLNWAGGDPLLNTFIHYPEGELARLIFHELAHQVLYVKNDTAFNESFATAVERLGVRQWLASEADEAARREYADSSQRREQFHALARATRARLAALYADATPGARDTSALLARKQQILQDFQARYAQVRAGWGGDAARWRSTDRWVAQANNAAFGAEAAYDEWVPAFEALFEREGRDWRRFYDAVIRLGDLPPARRHDLLKELTRA